MQDKMIISGMGSLSALGSNSEEIWKHYQDETTRITNCCFNKLDTPVGKLYPEDENLISKLRDEKSHYKRLDKTVLLGILAGRKAFKQASWNEDENVSINLGSSRGATQLFEKYHKNFVTNDEKRLSALVSPTTTLGNISSWLAYDLGVKGASFSHSITCSTALHSVLNAIAWLQSGMAEKFLVGGSEAPLSDFTIAQMRALKIYAEKSDSFPSLPLQKDKHRSSLVLGEGAAVFCMERDQGQNRIAKIAGVGYATELIEHNVSLSAEAECLQKSMKMALKNANLTSVDSIVMHAPGTLRGDQSEYKAIQKLFGKELPHIISTKYTTGHTFGASGALSMELAILMLQHQKTIKLPYESEPCGNPETLKNIMVNATGFGGNAVSIILSK
jgi:3-oxoacyl-[acyl-carrier-protein] synthase II